MVQTKQQLRDEISTLLPIYGFKVSDENIQVIVDADYINMEDTSLFELIQNKSEELERI